MSSHRLNVTLDGEYAAKLARVATRAHLNEGMLASSPLSSAIDDLDPVQVDIAELLDGVDDAWERTELNALRAVAGDTDPLDELVNVAQVALVRAGLRDPDELTRARETRPLRQTADAGALSTGRCSLAMAVWFRWPRPLPPSV